MANTTEAHEPSAMEKRIDLERRGKEPNQVKELNLDNTRATHVEGLSDHYSALETLSLTKVGLTSLKGFPKLPMLERLELSDNRISNGLTILKDCPKLSHLNLSNNKIKDLEVLEPLKSFDNLTHLDLFNNDVCNQEDFRSKVFKMLPKLKYLDDTDADENLEESEDEGDQNGAADSDDDDDEGGEEEEDEDDDDESYDDEEEANSPGLAAIYNDNLEDDEDGDFDEDAEGEEDDEDIEEEEESEEPRGKRRKFDEEDSGGAGGAE